MHLSILDNMRLIFFHFALVRAALPYCPFRRREYSGGDVEVMAGLKADLDRYPRHITYLWVPVSYRLWHRMLEQR
ncbi:hypothetical protein Peur_069668 [Populus x canadensis]